MLGLGREGGGTLMGWEGESVGCWIEECTGVHVCVAVIQRALVTERKQVKD